MNAPNARFAEHVLAGVRWIAALRSAAQLVSWLATLVVVRWVSPADYGLNAMLEAPLEMSLMLGVLGLDSALVQAPRLAPRQLESAFFLILVASLALFVGWFFGGVWLAQWFAEPALEPLCRALSGLFLLVPLRAIPNALMDREMQFKVRAQIELAASLLAAATTLTLALLGFGIWALVAGILLSRTLLTVLMMLAHPWFVWPRPGPDANALLGFGALMVLSSALTLLAGKLASLMAGPQLGAHALGLYAVALQFAWLPIAKAMPVVNPVLFPAFARLGGQTGAAVHYFTRAVELSALLVFPLMLGLAAIAPAFVALVLGPTWQDAAIPLALLSASMPFKLLVSLLKPVLGALGRPRRVVLINLVTVLLIAVAVPLALPHGVNGLALAALVIEPLVLGCALWLAREVMPVTPRALWRALRPALVAGTVMVLAVWGWQQRADGLPLAIALGGGVAVGALCYGACLQLAFPEVSARARRLLLGARLP